MVPQDQQQGPSTANTAVNGIETEAIDAQSEVAALSLLELSMIIGLPMALKAVMTLGVPRILAQHSGPLSAEEILLQIQDCKNKHDKVAADNLRIIMSILVQNNIFSDVSGDETGRLPSYSLTPLSRLLLNMPESTVLHGYNLNQHVKIQNAWLHLHDGVLDSNARPFKVANGMGLWEALAEDEELGSLFHNSFGSSVHMESPVFLQAYNGFEGIRTLVDVGGSYGVLIGAIVRANPHIRGINYDLPHIIASAPNVPGVEHVAGNFFESVPQGDAIIMKSILHDWNDEQCIKILQNCKRALPESGKVIIFEQVLLPPSNTSAKARLGVKLNLTMLATCDGKERYAEDWAEVISAAGFPKHRIIKVSGSFFDVIEVSMS